jgi:hypothetical protein
VLLYQMYGSICAAAVPCTPPSGLATRMVHAARPRRGVRLGEAVTRDRGAGAREAELRSTEARPRGGRPAAVLLPVLSPVRRELPACMQHASACR